MKKLLPILMLMLVFLVVPIVVRAGFFDLIGSILQTIICLFTGALCPDPCLRLVAEIGTAAYKLCHIVDNVSGALYAIGWSLALVVILWGGISSMVSAGQEERVKSAKKIITHGLVGTAIVLCSGFILGLLAQFLSPLFY